MELSIIKCPKLVVALDIGSTYSGYAWQYRNEFEDRRDIHFNTNWNAHALKLIKTKTCLMFKYDMRNQRKPRKKSSLQLDPIEAEDIRIGHDAENTYMKIAKTRKERELLGNFYLFKRFKMLLYGKNVHDEMIVKDQLGQPLRLFDVMTLFIKELITRCLDTINERRQREVNKYRTLFVVTVPAIWSDTAKQFMRKATIAAGAGKRNVLLALEPEAAVISCLYLTSLQREDMNNFGDVGQKFLVADLGGETSDLSAVEVLEDGSLKELYQPMGKDVGGQNINNAFLQHCQDIFQGQKWLDLSNNIIPADALKMETDFEISKMQIGLEDSDWSVIEIELPLKIRRCIKNNKISFREGSNVQYDDPFFRLDFIPQKFFNTTCDLIYENTIKEALSKDEAKGIRTVILVGGFSESPIVIKTLRERVEKDFSGVKVVVPDSPFKSVLQGAVLYGHDPMIFSSRISKETYSVDVYVAFDETKHDPSKKWHNEESGEILCSNIFHVHVKKCQSVSLLEPQPTMIYCPVYKQQKAISFNIYSSTNIYPMYTTDEGCKHIGTVRVEMPDTTGGTGRKVEVSMLYGGTQIAVLAKDVTTGKEVHAEIVFG